MPYGTFVAHRGFDQSADVGFAVVRPNGGTREGRDNIPPNDPPPISAGCQTALVRHDHGLDAVAHPELGQDARDVRLHSRLVQVELRPDLRV